MLHLKNSLIVLGMLLLFTTSCKKEFTNVGNKLIDEPHYEGKLYTESKVKIYDQAVDKVFSTNLPINAIGIYNDPVFGRLESDVITTLSFEGIEDRNGDFYDPLSDGFGDNVKLIDAKLIVPYFSHTVTDETTGEVTYELDSIYGNQPFTIKIYETNYLLPNYDPSTNLVHLTTYQSDFDFSPYNNTILGDSIHFTPSNKAYITYKRNEDGTFDLDDDDNKQVKDSIGPHFIMPLDTTFFRTKIFDHSGEDIITNSDRFADYFRGIYIDAVGENDNGRFMQMNLANAKIKVSYTYEITDDNDTPNDTSDDTIKTIYKKLSFKFNVPKVCHYTNVRSSNMQTAVTNSNEILGDDKVYIKGDAGSEAIINLFDNQQLRELRDKDWMINLAELIVYVDDNSLTNPLSEAGQLLIYDYDNQKHLTDLYAQENIESAYAVYDGTLREDDNGDHYYSFKITRHIRNILKFDKLNVKLAMRVVPKIDPSAKLSVSDKFRDPDAFIPSGTIIYGNQTTVTDKKPVLKIYYTDPE